MLCCSAIYNFMANIRLTCFCITVAWLFNLNLSRLFVRSSCLDKYCREKHWTRTTFFKYKNCLRHLLRRARLWSVVAALLMRLRSARAAARIRKYTRAVHCIFFAATDLFRIDSTKFDANFWRINDCMYTIDCKINFLLFTFSPILDRTLTYCL